MKTYQVTVTPTFSGIYEIEANSREEALREIQDRWGSGGIYIEDMESTGVEFDIEEDQLSTE